MRSLKKILFAGIFVISGMILTTLGIDAVDKYDRISESLIGRLVSGGEDGPCPAEMVFVPGPTGGFCLDRYEASVGPDCPFSAPSSQSDTVVNIEVKACRPLTAAGALPWRFVSKDQAARLCARIGKRLPTNEEWQLAALDTPDPAADWGAADCQVDKNWLAQPGKTGSGANCQSPAGAFDLVGNIWEWVNDTAIDGTLDGRTIPESGYVSGMADDGLPSDTASEGKVAYGLDHLWIKRNEIRAIARGGYWDSQMMGGVYAAYIVLGTDTAGPGIGFRCVR